MSLVRPARGCPAVALFLALAAAGPARAGDPPAAPRPAAGNRPADTLEAARDELRRLRTDHAELPAAAASAPRLVPPEWHGSGGASTPAPARPARAGGADPAKGAATSPNWLVDAMQDPGRSSGGFPSLESRAAGRADAADAERPAEFKAGTAPGRAASRSGAAPVAGGTERTLPGPVVNPLAAFLDDWMSPQDFALLTPGLEPGRLGSSWPGGGGTTPAGRVAPFATVAVPGLSVGSAVPATPHGSAGPGVEKENPFLSALQFPPAPASPPPRSAVPTPPVPVSSPLAVPAGQPVATPPPTSRVPEFARPAEDARYFKPLKRF